jgi:transposase
MAEPFLSDELWVVVEPTIPKHVTSSRGGRPRLDDRKALAGILFILKSGMPWEMFPQEMCCGSGMPW